MTIEIARYLLYQIKAWAWYEKNTELYSAIDICLSKLK